MNANALRDWIGSLTQDIDFEYGGKSGCICPFSLRDISLCYDGAETTVHSLDEAMTTPFVQGKNLTEICDVFK